MYNKELNDYVNINYKSLYKMLNYEWRKMESIEFNEDIFHETLIKCMDKFNDKKFNENEFKAYITTSFKMNIIREKQYHVNLMKSDTDVETLNYFITNNFNCDFHIIMDGIKEKFGKLNYEKFLDWLENKTIKEINEKYKCNNTRYLIDKIKIFVKNEYEIKKE